MATIDIGRQTSPLEGILGILGGLGQGFESLKQAQEAKNLEAAKLLMGSGQYDLAPAQVGAQSVWGALSGQGKDAQGNPLFTLGGNQFALQKRAQLAYPGMGDTPTGAATPSQPATGGTTTDGASIPASSPLATTGTIQQGPLGQTPQPKAPSSSPKTLPQPGTPEFADFASQREMYARKQPDVVAAMTLYNQTRKPEHFAQISQAMDKARQDFTANWTNASNQYIQTQTYMRPLKQKTAEAIQNMEEGENKTQLLQKLRNAQTPEELDELMSDPLMPGPIQAELRKQSLQFAHQTNERLGSEVFQAGQQDQRLQHQTSERREGESDKAYQKRVEMAPKAREAMDALDQQRQVLSPMIERARQQIANASGWFPTTGFVGNVAKHTPGTEAYNLAETLQTIKTNIGFDKLSQMRAASPTNGALGQVSDFENKMLQSVLGSLDQGQSKQQILDNLKRVEDILTDSAERRKSAFQNDFGDIVTPGGAVNRQLPGGQSPRAGATTPPSSSTGTQPSGTQKSSTPPQSAPVVIPKDRLDALVSKAVAAGVPREQAIARLKAAGYKIEGD